MAYFANSTEQFDYEEKFCGRCGHYPNCTVIMLHLLHNYNECNNPDSILHVLIPQNDKGENQQCSMFIENSNKDVPGQMKFGDVTKI